jgi:hypothetical protein
MKGLFRFLASSAGRGVRVVAGLGLMATGIWGIGRLGGWIVAIIGLVPFGAGALDKCVFAPLFGYPFEGERLRHAVAPESRTEAP